MPNRILALITGTLSFAAPLVAQLQWTAHPVLWGRVTPALGYESSTGSMVMTSGHLPSTRADDTWRLTTNGWTRLTNAGPFLQNAHGATDLSRGRFVAFGIGVQSRVFEMWAWSGAAWSHMQPSTTPPTANYSYSTDAVTGRMIYTVQGASGHDTWEFDGTTWNLLPAILPGNSFIMSMTFDASRGVHIALTLPANRLWEFQQGAWVDRTPPNQPVGMVESTLLYDATTRRVLLLQPNGELWTLDPGALWTSLGQRGLPGPDSGGSATTDWSTGRPVVYSQSVTWTWTGAGWRVLDHGAPGGFLNEGVSCFDSRRRRLVFFQPNGAAYPCAPVWEWDGARWTRTVPPLCPLPRVDAAMTFDRARGVAVLFGGRIGSLNLNDHWEWDGVSWTRRTPPILPMPRSDQALTFDDHRGVVVMFGTDRFGVTETWEWDGRTWALRHAGTTGVPPGRSYLFPDPTRGTILAVAKDSQGPTWQWDGIAWSVLQTAPSPNLSGLTFDHARGRAVGYCGASVMEWDGNQWLRRPVSIPNLNICDTDLLEFDGAHVVYKPSGVNRTIPAALMMLYKLGATDPAIAETFGASCAGSVGLPGLAPHGRPWTGAPFRIELSNVPSGSAAIGLLGSCTSQCGATSFPVDLSVVGMIGCHLYLLPVFSLPAVADTSGRVVWSLPIAASPNLVGAEFFAQAANLDPPANALGIVTTNAVRAVVGAQ